MPATGAVTANDQQTFLNESISGGAVTAYDQRERRSICSCGGRRPTARPSAVHANTWNLFYQSRSGASGTQPAWDNAGTNYTFSAAGR